MESKILLQDKQKEFALKKELEITIHVWVERTFNFIQVQVLEKYCDNNLSEYIRNMSVEEAFLGWLSDCITESKIEEWATDSEQDDVLIKMDIYEKHQGSIKESFSFAFGDLWDEFKEWCCSVNESDIMDWIYERENYPMWNTCFEFRDSWFNSSENVEICMSVGLGVIEGLDDFNNLVFMTSAGHSFYSAYWIPLYFKLYPSEAEKYTGINYSDL